MIATHDFNALPVVEDGRMVGFDFLKAFAFTTRQMVPHYDELMSTTAGEVMTEAVVDVRPEARLTRVLQLMVNLKARSLPVIDREGHLAGIISRADIIRALKDSVQQRESST
jgi:CBS-domain-containing membrane protein